MNMNSTSTQTPTMLLDPNAWAKEFQQLAAEYSGLPEGQSFLLAARRFMALSARITQLENEVMETRLQLSEDL